ncbi:MAG: sugar ABC transporter permease YjfF [Propionibacteriaceae bacterium]|nr:sugar ABC transporter permease YjfF [Propionibacteriaceae bacterium]
MNSDSKNRPQDFRVADLNKGFFGGVFAKFYGNNLLVLITFAMLVLIYSAASFIFRDQNFGSLNSIFSMLHSWPHLVVIAAGMTMVLISGGIDISVGGQCAMYCMMFAYFMQEDGWNVNSYVMIAVVLATGLVFGFAQGVLVAYFKIQPFIVTLAGMFFARGLTAIISEKTIGIKNEDFLGLAAVKFTLPFGGYTDGGGVYQAPYIYLYAILALLGVVVLYIVMTWTGFGRSVYAVGGSEQSAMLMGLNPKRIVLQVFVIQGLMTAFGSFLFCLSLPGGAVEKAVAFEMNAIAAAVIGGALLTGGVGNILGSLAGTLIQLTILKIITSVGTLSSGWGPISTAAMMAFFIAMQSVLTSGRRKRK